MTKSSTMQVKNFSFGYNNQAIFDSINFSINANLVIFSGPSGCGKTTLMKILSGYIENTSTNLYGDASNFFMTQEDSLFPWLSGIQNIDSLPHESVHAKQRRDGVLDRYRYLLQKYAYQMSFGQRRTIELVRLFGAERNRYFLDEPFNFLDTEKRVHFAQEITNLSNEGKLVVLSSHSDDDIALFDDFQLLKFSGTLPNKQLVSSNVSKN